MNYRCPHDDHVLEPKTSHEGRVYSCPFCRGEMINVSVLRKDPRMDAGVTEIWRQVLAADNQSGVKCPSCEEKMTRAPIPGSGETIDICKPCQLAWLDRGEYDILPKQTWEEVEPQEPPMSQEARMAIMNEELAALKEQYAPRDDMLDFAPHFLSAVDDVFKPGQATLDYEAPSRPIASWAVAGAMIFTFMLFATKHFNYFDWSIMPIFSMSRYGGFLYFVSNFFLCADFLALAFSLAIVLLALSDVEKELGARVTLTLLAIAHIVGEVVFLFTLVLSRSPEAARASLSITEDLPPLHMNGASFGLGAVIAYYYLRNTDNPIRAYLYAGLWFVLQVHLALFVMHDVPFLAFALPRLLCVGIGLFWAYATKYSEKFARR